MAASANADRSSSHQLSVLLATNYLSSWTGSETLILTLIEGLREHVHKLTIYARHLDKAWASRYAGSDICLVDNLDDIRSIEFDLAHVQHSSCLVDVRFAFPTLPILFSSLGVLPFLEQPAPFEIGISRYLAISEEVAANLVEHGVQRDKIEIVRNLVSERRFLPTAPIRPLPERILVLSYKINESRKRTLESAAHAAGASIRFVGGLQTTLSQDQLVSAINEADVVVSLGRGVVEAMLCGRVPLVFDIHGGDGLVTPDNMDKLRTCNFSGRCYRQEYSVDELTAELGKYRQEFGQRLQVIAEEQFGLSSNVPRLLAIYRTTASTEVTLTSGERKAIAFCASLSKEDLRQCRRHQQLVADLQSELGRVKGTFSWQITKPLRFLAYLLRKVGMILGQRS